MMLGWTSNQSTKELPQKTGVYLLHFRGGQLGTKGRGTCKHYMGSTVNLRNRMRDHASGNAANVTRVAGNRGLTLELVKFHETETEQEARKLEKLLKSRGHFPDRECPVCMKRRGLL